MQPMLATSCDETALNRFLDEGGAWWVEQKLDGHRLIIQRHELGYNLRNRNGDPYSKPFPEGLISDLETLPEGTWLDGELVGDTFWAFDLPRFGEDLTNSAKHDMERRRILLEQIFALWAPEQIRLVPRSTQAKVGNENRRYFEKLKDAGAEGVILKHVWLPYQPGIRSLKMLKYKFVETVDCIVSEVNRNGKEAIGLALINAETGNVYEVGACSMIGKDPTVKAGDVVEVRYLYAGSNGRLYQPHFERKRDDKPIHECDNAQLKHVTKEVITP